jgi:hypothetical protein
VSTLITVLTVLGGVLAGVGTMLAVAYSRNRDARADLLAEVRAREALKASTDAAQKLAQAAAESAAGLRSEISGLRAVVSALESRTTLLESKMEVFWRNVAFDVSKILHSPHSGWEELDALLEKFRERAISQPEMADLEENLRAMVDGRWESGETSRADQVAASLLLRAIEQTR